MFGGLPGEFWRAAAVVAIARSGVYIQFFLGYYLARSLGLSSGQVAVVLAAWGAGWAAGTPLGGWLADRVGARAVVTIGNIIAAGAYLSAGTARSFPALVATAGLVGLVQDAWRPAVMSVVASAAPGEMQRKRCLTLIWWLVQVTAVFAALTGGLIGAQVGMGWLFPANAAAALAAAVAARTLPGAASSRQPRSGTWAADPLLLGFTVLTVAALAVEAQSMVALPVRFASTGIPPFAAGLIIAVNPVTCAAVQPFVQGWLVRLPAVGVCAAGMVLTGVGIAVTGSGHGLPWFASTSVIWVLGEVALLGCGPALVASIAPPGQVGSYLGLWQASMGLAVLTAAVSGAALIHVGGLHLLWASCAATGLASAIGCAFLARPVAARAAQLARGSADAAAARGSAGAAAARGSAEAAAARG
jgi:MFS family permease